MANAVINALALEPQRYNRLLELVGLTPGLLTATLRSLESDGLVERRLEAQAFPYALTAAGRELAQGRVGTPG
jgi:DNA-binding HxlR family transcriptional regulator